MYVKNPLLHQENWVESGFKLTHILFCLAYKEVVGWCEGLVYHASLGRPADIGLQLHKACCPCSR